MRRVLNSSEPTGLKPSKVGDSYQPNPASETDDIIFSLWVYLEKYIDFRAYNPRRDSERFEPY
jgi:hypothetical protein